MSRAEFLKNIWKPYPQVNFEAAAQGRVLEIEERTLVLQRPLGHAPIRVVCEKMKEGTDLSVLQIGDIVSVNTHGVVTLHAPALTITKTCSEAKFKHIQKWSELKKQIRFFFEKNHFTEVETPSLVACPGSEPTLDVFSCELVVGSKKEKLFLPTSPEWHLKKALSQNFEKIYEIKSCFRNGEITQRHQPEFTLLEWYRAYSNLQAIKKDSLLLIEHLCSEFKVPKPQHIHSYSVAELFKKFLDFELTPETTEAELRSLAEKQKVDLRAAESIDDCFFLLFMEKIENQWSPNDLVFVEKYPPYQAALARLTPDGWGDRFEIYWKGLELANAFHELNDPKIQRLRFNDDVQKKAQLKKESIRSDEDFFAALDQGLPPSGGIALGVERLYMALFDVKEIHHLKLFPYQI